MSCLILDRLHLYVLQECELVEDRCCVLNLQSSLSVKMSNYGHLNTYCNDFSKITIVVKKKKSITLQKDHNAEALE